jgi:phenylacetate-CoA ligase
VTAWNDPPGGFHPASGADFLPLPQLRAVQLQRLQSVVGRAFERVALFRRRMEEKRLTPASVAGLDDLARLPFTVKTHLRDT